MRAVRSDARRTYWRWHTPQGWNLLVHWSCAPVAAAALALAAIQIGVEHPDLAAASRWFYAGLHGFVLFGSVAVHELGHLLMARRLGLTPTCVVLRGWWGATVLPRPSDTPAKEALFALAGPAASLVAASVAGAMALSVPDGPFQALVSGAAFVNGVMVVASVVPGYPLDGGLAVRAWRWHVTGDRHLATRDSRWAGYVTGLALLLLGLIAVHSAMGWVAISAGLATLVGPVTAHFARSSMLSASDGLHETNAAVSR